LKYIHYKSKRSLEGWSDREDVIVTACGVTANPTPKVTRKKKKVTCKKCRRTKEFKQKTMWQKFWKKIKWQ